MHYFSFYFCNIVMRLFLLVQIFVGLISLSSTAQIVNIENRRLSEKEEGWTGSNDLSFSLTENTTQVWQVGNNLRIDYVKGRHNAFLLSVINIVKAGESDLLNNGFEHLRYNYDLLDNNRLILEVFRQTQFNKIQKIKLRSLYGVGLRYAIVDKDSANISIGTLPMAEFEDLTNNISNRHIRLSTYLSFDFQFTKTVGLNSITYYQPDILFAGDYRISNETSVRLGITEKLKLKVIFKIYYDQFPTEGVPKRIYSLRNAISYSF